MDSTQLLQFKSQKKQKQKQKQKQNPVGIAMVIITG